MSDNHEEQSTFNQSLLHTEPSVDIPWLHKPSENIPKCFLLEKKEKIVYSIEK